MRQIESGSRLVDRFNERHPQLMWGVVGVLMVFVTLLLLMTTEAPIILYQAF